MVLEPERVFQHAHGVILRQTVCALLQSNITFSRCLWCDDGYAMPMLCPGIGLDLNRHILRMHHTFGTFFLVPCQQVVALLVY